MKNDKGILDRSDLRKRAEKTLGGRYAKDEDVSLMSPDAMKELIHELGVHQIELEMQNEELRNAYSELEKARDKYFDQYDLAPVGYLTLDNNHQIAEVNLTGAEMLGVERRKLIKQRFSSFVASDSRNAFYLHLKKTLRTKKKQVCELKLSKRDGTFCYVQMVSVLFIDTEENAHRFQTAITDITESKRLQNQLQQAHKMQAIGTLSGGIAHDINNILGIIMGNTELAMMDVPEGNPANRHLREVREACLRVRDVVKQILTFSRQTEHQRIPKEIGPIVKKSLKLLRSLIPTTIDIHQDIPGDLYAINVDTSQMNQIMINLCTNAAHAMNDRAGILRVSLENVELAEGDVSHDQVLSPGSYVRLTVRDNGRGIDPAIIERIFDPYFTSKGIGEGTGMGLAVVHGIVADHGGSISVTSEPGKGTAFHIFLPGIKGEPAPKTEISFSPPTGSERILLVDDEEAIVRVIKRMLEQLGYEVVTRMNGLEALDMFRSQPHQIDLVITDQTMPGMTGENLAKEIIATGSDIPIILCTGFSEQIDENRAMEMGISAFVMKPAEMFEIAKTIRKVLGEKKSISNAADLSHS